MRLYSTPVEIETALPIEEVSRRLRDAVLDPYNLLGFLRSRLDYPVSGRVGPNRCWLEYRKFYHNGFKRRLSLNFVPTDSGTSLRGEFAPSIFVTMFSALWCLLASLLFLGSLAQFVRARGHSTLELFSSVGMLLCYFALFNFGIWLSSFTESDVITFVEGLLDEPGAGALTHEEIVIRPRRRF